MWQKLKPYLLSAAATLAVGGLSALLTAGNMNIYEATKAPPLSPPSWLHKSIPQNKAFTEDEAGHDPDLCAQFVFQFHVEHFLFQLPRIFVFLRLARSAVADHFFNDGQLLSDR